MNRTGSGSEHPWDTSSYGETQPYSPQNNRTGRTYEYTAAPVGYAEQPAAAPPKRFGRLPYYIVSLLTAALGVLQLFLPLADWVVFRYQVFGREIAGGALNLFDLAKKFLFSGSIVEFLTGFGDYLNITKYTPVSVKEKFDQGRAGGIVVMAVLAFSLALFLVFAVMAVTRRRAAFAVGIAAAIINIAGDIAVFYAMGEMNSILEKYDIFSWKNMQFHLSQGPTLAIIVSSAVIVFCIVAAVLRRKAYRR